MRPMQLGSSSSNSNSKTRLALAWDRLFGQCKVCPCRESTACLFKASKEFKVSKECKGHKGFRRDRVQE